MRFASRRDANHADIVARYEAFHCSVLDLSRVGSGCPDVLIGCGGRDHGLTELVEIKTEEGELNAAQELFADEWRGPLRVIRTFDDVESHVKDLRRRLMLLVSR